MASKDYIVVELSSPTQRDTFQAKSVTLVSENGEHQILPMHKEWTGFQQPQTITIELHNDNSPLKSIEISDAISKVIHEETNRSKLLIACNFYSYDNSNILNSINEGTEAKQKAAKELAAKELIPSYNPTEQELRDIEQDIRKEFEESLK